MGRARGKEGIGRRNVTGPKSRSEGMKIEEGKGLGMMAIDPIQVFCLGVDVI